MLLLYARRRMPRGGGNQGTVARAVDSRSRVGKDVLGRH